VRLCSVVIDHDEVAAIDVAGRGVVQLSAVDADAPVDLLNVIGVLSAQRLDTWSQRVAGLADDAFVDPVTLRWAPPYRHPPKLWGIGLNYVDHADDLAAAHPTAPASSMKGDHTIIGPGEPIILPVQSRRVTAEGELGIVIGRECRNVEEADALEHVAGVCCVLDQTAEDILQENPRFLTRAKNFPTFFAFGAAHGDDGRGAGALRQPRRHRGRDLLQRCPATTERGRQHALLTADADQLPQQGHAATTR